MGDGIRKSTLKVLFESKFGVSSLIDHNLDFKFYLLEIYMYGKFLSSALSRS